MRRLAALAAGVARLAGCTMPQAPEEPGLLDQYTDNPILLGVLGGSALLLLLVGLMALSRRNAMKEAELQESLLASQREDDLGHALALMHKHGALRDTIGRARLYGERAIAALAAFPDSAEKTALSDVVAFVVERAR